MGTKGILGEKLGMTQVFTDEGRALPVTVIKAGPCRVVQVKTLERDGYAAVQLSYGSRKRAGKPTTGHFARAGIDEPARHLVELRTDETFEPGQEITAAIFEPGERADVVGACATPSRVFRGTRMAGQMGNVRVTVLNLEVVEADAERGLLLLKGAVPGPVGGLVMVRSSVKSGNGKVSA